MIDEKHGNKPETHVEVRVTTTSGSYPKTGFDAVPAHQPVKQQLKKAADALTIVDTTGWVAKVNGTDIDTGKSYADNGLSGTMSIDYGPAEGGGGNE
jgi:hypothetical protein